MIVLDTDHLSELQRKESKIAARLIARITVSMNRRAVATIISAEEQLRGRLATIRHKKEAIEEVPFYEHLTYLFEFYHKWPILPFDEEAALQLELLKKQRIRVGTMDLKIASIVLVRRATLLSANLRDFQQVPGLHVEDWLRD